RSDVIAWAERSENGTTARSTTARTVRLLQVARVREPIPQNTSCDNASCEATNCSNATRALKVKTSAMPNSTTPSTPAARLRASASSSSTDAKAAMNALSGTIQSGGMNGRLRPSTIASAAPNEAAEDTPSVNGLASGL